MEQMAPDHPFVIWTNSNSDHEASIVPVECREGVPIFGIGAIDFELSDLSKNLVMDLDNFCTMTDHSWRKYEASFRYEHFGALIIHPNEVTDSNWLRASRFSLFGVVPPYDFYFKSPHDVMGDVSKLILDASNQVPLSVLKRVSLSPEVMDDLFLLVQGRDVIGKPLLVSAVLRRAIWFISTKVKQNDPSASYKELVDRAWFRALEFAIDQRRQEWASLTWNWIKSNTFNFSTYYDLLDPKVASNMVEGNFWSDRTLMQSLKASSYDARPYYEARTNMLFLCNGQANFANLRPEEIPTPKCLWFSDELPDSDAE